MKENTPHTNRGNEESHCGSIDHIAEGYIIWKKKLLPNGGNE